MADFDDDLFADDFDIDDALIEGGDVWDDEAIFRTTLYLDTQGFEADELMEEAPRLDYPADFARYMAGEAIFDIFNLWDEDAPEGMKEGFELNFEQFVHDVLEPAVEKIGGWGWFDSCVVDVAYDMLTGDMSLDLKTLCKSDVEHDPEALTQYAPADKEASKKEALQMDGETDIEIQQANVQVEADMDEGDGDLAEWIFDAITNALQIAGRGNVDVHAMDQISDKCADICGQDLGEFGTLKFHVDDDGSISGFDFNGSHYDLDL